MSVTVGLPVYNAAPYLQACLASVIHQTWQDWQLIVVDDGSTDGSVDIVRALRDPRITLIQDGHNLGLPARLNQIAAIADTALLARMDADDVMHPERLARQVASLAEHPEVDVLGTDVITIDAEGRPYGRRTSRTPTNAADVLRSGAFIHPTVMGRTDWFRRHPYDPHNDRAEDFDLWVRTFEQSTFATLNEPLLFYRELGLPYLRKYARSARAVRKVLCQHGPRIVGRGPTLRLLAQSLAKQTIFTLGSRLGRENALILRRAVLLTPAERDAASLVLRGAITFMEEV